MEFNKLMSDLLGRQEDADCHRTADRMMDILLDCNPREGAHCDMPPWSAKK
ncbi:MAG: hypothetical protein Q7U64_13385 [Desulfocapsaceae bacterium]|jgi:hypothetical protein|nr:hypothetical protein [Desulfocapsaceae bacterium]